MTEQTEDEKIREAMSLLGRRTSERKSAASRINMAHANTFRVPNKPCNCGTVPHRSTCPVYNREATKRSRAKMSAV